MSNKILDELFWMCNTGCGAQTDSRLNMFYQNLLANLKLLSFTRKVVNSKPARHHHIGSSFPASRSEKQRVAFPPISRPRSAYRRIEHCMHWRRENLKMHCPTNRELGEVHFWAFHCPRFSPFSIYESYLVGLSRVVRCATRERNIPESPRGKSRQKAGGAQKRP